MKRNSTTLFLSSPGATTSMPWVNNAPDFSSFTNPTLSVLQQSWQQFLDSGEELEIIPDPEPVVEPPVPDWDGFNAYILSNPMLKSYRDTVRSTDGDLNAVLFNAYSLIESNGVSAFSTIWGVWCGVSNITTAHRQEIAGIANSYSLPSNFVSIIAE